MHSAGLGGVRETCGVKRDFNMDLARAVAITLVTLYHLYVFYGVPAGLFGIPSLAARAIAKNGFIGVDVFFVVSGYAMILTWSRGAPPFRSQVISFWISRILRLYPAYLMAVVGWAVLLLLIDRPYPPRGPLHIAAHLGFLHTLSMDTFFSVSGVLWSIAVEVHFYLLFPILVIVPRYVRLGVALAAIIYTCLVATLVDHPSRVMTWNAISFLPLFVLGMEIATSAGSRWLRSFALVAGVLAMADIAAGFSLLNFWSVELREDSVYDRMLIGAGIASMILVFVPPRVGHNLLSSTITQVGIASYSIYLYNYIFQVFPGKVASGLMGWCASFVFVMLFGTAMWWLIERNTERLRRSFVRARRDRQPAIATAAQTART